MRKKKRRKSNKIVGTFIKKGSVNNRTRRKGAKKRKFRNNLTNIFSRKASSSAETFKKKVSQRKFLTNFFKYSFISITSILVIWGGYQLVTYVLALRSQDSSQVVITEGSVVGLNNVPIYPDSEFIFKNTDDNESVRTFLSEGRSVYRLPLNTSQKNIYEYYNIELPKLEWKHVLSVPLESEDMLPGEYWIRESVGVRIYSKLNDIWYETITVNEAQTGLSEIVTKEIERELLLATDEYTTLLPDYPWILKIPNEYVASYTGTEISDLRAVSFKKIGSDSIISITPLGYANGITYDSYLQNYLDEFNKEEDTDWLIVNTYLTVIDNQEAIQGSIVYGTQQGEVAVVQNERTTAIYIISSLENSNPFFGYILENIESKEISY